MCYNSAYSKDSRFLCFGRDVNAPAEDADFTYETTTPLCRDVCFGHAVSYRSSVGSMISLDVKRHTMHGAFLFVKMASVQIYWR